MSFNYTGLKYKGKCNMNLEETVYVTAEAVEELSEKLEGIGSGGAAVEIGTTLPDTATNGTITAEELSKLQESDSNYIIFKKEIYLLMDKQRNEGYITYSHVGVNGAMANVVKTITITISTMTWVMIETPIAAGGGRDKNSRYGIAAINSKKQREILLGSWEGVYAKRVTVSQPTAAAITEIGFVDIENNQDYNYKIDEDIQGLYFGLQIVIKKDAYPGYEFPMFKAEANIGAVGIWVSPNGPNVENVQKLFFLEQSMGADTSEAPYVVEDLYE